MVHCDKSPCSSLVLKKIIGAENWRLAAGTQMARLHECRSDRYAAQLLKASRWLSLARKVLDEPAYVASLPDQLREMQHSLTELQRQAPAGAMGPGLEREMQ